MVTTADLTDMYNAALGSGGRDKDVDVFADGCIQRCPSANKEEISAIVSLIVPHASIKTIKQQPDAKVRQLQLQVISRLTRAAMTKCDPIYKSEKKELYSILSSMAMTMDAIAMADRNDAVTEQSAFNTFVVDTLSSRFQSMLPKSFKWLYKKLELSPTEVQTPLSQRRVAKLSSDDSDRDSQLTSDCSIAKALQEEVSITSRDTRTAALFKEVVIASSQPKPSPPIIPVQARKIIAEPVPAQSYPAQPVRQTMVLKTPERPKRPPMKKRLVHVASSPPLRKPVKRLGSLMGFK
ncbi:hypothetical protein LEN26_007790 [Aphanomyces euteiches]|nr:hypothetical protein Ae201684P_013591 [Aphanomyces euteiches]KAH9116057.1 hypothetical protein AeMF1_009921 [Aphanomyces euteiches]KAH9131257.1 hypothetical protein LEN26_007790 [Aphanomyces euteiches]KAH9156910.1 hypothetical protein AeRB84_001202 [Aphanomyces euteiches]KAH9197171.1 hypothetical protein AeNC1_000883 [Aphanomyces euteiches]